MRWYSAYYFEVMVYQILIELLHFFKEFSDLTLFPDNFYNFHLIGLKLCGLLAYEVMLFILFQVCNTPNFDRVIALFVNFQQRYCPCSAIINDFCSV